MASHGLLMVHSAQKSVSSAVLSVADFHLRARSCISNQQQQEQCWILEPWKLSLSEKIYILILIFHPIGLVFSQIRCWILEPWKLSLSQKIYILILIFHPIGLVFSQMRTTPIKLLPLSYFLYLQHIFWQVGGEHQPTIVQVLCRKRERDRDYHPYKVTDITPPPRNLGIRCFPSYMQCGESITIEDKGYIVSSVTYRYQLRKGKYEPSENRLDVQSTGRYLMNHYLETLLEQS